GFAVSACYVCLLFLPSSSWAYKPPRDLNSCPARNRSGCVVLGTLQCNRVTRQADLLHTFGAVCGTRDVKHATAIGTGKILQQYETCRNFLAGQISALNQEVRHNA